MSYSIQDFTLTNGCPSRLLIVSPDNVPTNAVIQFVYGFGEHIEMFEEFGRFFAENGFAFVVHDQQGHGLRAKENHTQGIVSTYQDFLDDITLVRKKIDADFQNLPIILFGFSMGGNIVLNYLLTYPDAPYIKTVAQSPWLRLAKPQPKLADFLAATIGKLTPKPTLNAKLDFEKIMHDPKSVAVLRADNIYHMRMGLRLYTEVRKHGEFALAHAAQIHVPLLLLQGDDDAIVSPQATYEFAKLAGTNVQLVKIADGYHALHVDTDAEMVRDKIVHFVDGK